MNGRDIWSGVAVKIVAGITLGVALGAGGSTLAWKSEASDMIRRTEVEKLELKLGDPQRRMEAKIESLQTAVARLEVRVEFLIQQGKP